jgi:hypothetical protein
MSTTFSRRTSLFVSVYNETIIMMAEIMTAHVLVAYNASLPIGKSANKVSLLSIVIFTINAYLEEPFQSCISCFFFQSRILLDCE